MKKAMSLILILAVALVCAGCSGTNEAPRFAARAGDINIPTAFGYNEWDGAIYDREDLCVQLVKEDTDFPYVSLGETITLSLDGAQPDSCVMQDYIVGEDGRNLYTEKEITTSDLSFKNGQYQFVLEENPAAHLSSDSEAYETGGIMRGFKLTCTFGENECEYAFIIRTDASK